jgi:replicative DNA helicase|tara:strand:- start:3020 stop:4381 length:1362 start_codon:yes stop_codon:yes gene_type:complete
MEKLGSKFSTSFQNKVISAILSDKPFTRQIYDIILPEYFDSEASEWLVKTVLAHFDEYETMPTLDVLKVKINKIERDVLKTSVVDTLKFAWNHLGSDDLKYIKEQVLDFCINQSIKNAILDSVTLLEDGKYDTIKKKIDNAMKAGQDSDIGLEWKTMVTERYEDSVRNVVSTGWDVVDEITQGGFGKGELILFAAPPGIGKSWALVNIGVNAMKQGKIVAHYTLELNEGYTGQRYDAVLSGVAVANLKYNMEDVQKAVENVKGDLVIKHYPTKTAGVTSLKAHMDKMTLQGKKPDIVIVDYADLLRAPSAKEKRHEELEEIIEDLRGLAGEYEVPVFTASQINRSGADDDIITGTKIAGSFSKMMTADFVVSLSRKIEDKLAGTGRWHVIKNRFGPDGMTFPSKANFSTGQIHIYNEDSINGRQTQKDMKGGESLVRKELAQKYKEMSGDIGF